MVDSVWFVLGGFGWPFRMGFESAGLFGLFLAMDSADLGRGKMLFLHLLPTGRGKIQNSSQKFNLASTKFFRSYRDCELKSIDGEETKEK